MPVPPKKLKYPETPAFVITLADIQVDVVCRVCFQPLIDCQVLEVHSQAYLCNCQSHQNEAVAVCDSCITSKFRPMPANDADGDPLSCWRKVANSQACKFTKSGPHQPQPIVRDSYRYHFELARSRTNFRLMQEEWRVFYL